MMRLEKTTLWIPQSLLPSPGWRAVYWIHGRHVETPIHALALATPFEAIRGTGRIVPRTLDHQVTWEVLGLEYGYADGWNRCSDASNFCTLLPPEVALETFTREPYCVNPHQEQSC